MYSSLPIVRAVCNKSAVFNLPFVRSCTSNRSYSDSGSFKKQDLTFATRVIHAAQDPEQWTDGKPVVLPISLSTTFKQDAPGVFTCEYSRTGNPTRDTLEKVVASLEGAKHGMAFGSGMAAISTVVNLLSSGDHIVSLVDMYGGTLVYLKQVADRLGIKTTFVQDTTDPANIINAIQDNTKLIWAETPSNPTLKMIDIERVATMAREKTGGRVLLAVDNTFLSPYFQRPLELGADLVMHSATKYLNGHSDVLMGMVVTNNEDVHSRLRNLQNIIGAVPSPFECYLVNRGLKTLPLRMRKHMENGLAVARFLESHPAVERVLHPGLPSHPQHELAKRQCYGHSGMVTFFIRGGLDECRIFLKAIKVITLAESLGGYESLVKLPALMPERYELGVSPNLIRFSVGLEDKEDLIADLDQALKASQKK